MAIAIVEKRKTEMETKAYKVVLVKEEKLVSVSEVLKSGRIYPTVAVSRERNIFVEYEIGRTTVPIVGKLFVFETLEDAENFVIKFSRNFALYSEETAILEGVAENPKKSKRLMFAGRFTYEFIEEFWKLKKNKKKLAMTVADSPRGSMTCDSFTPQRIVD
jgi:hypothetical protein